MAWWRPGEWRRRRRPPGRLEPASFAPAPDGGVLVGGAVRDLLLERAPRDLDWLVPEPERAAREAAAALGGSAFALDAERGHWRAVGSGATRDFAPLRGELEADLRARDFTVNAIAVRTDGRLVDPTGGRRDLRRRRLRMTSAAALREDPLRALRAVRLAAELGFRLEPATAREVAAVAEEQAAGALRIPAWERVRDELDRILLTPVAGRALAEAETLGLLGLYLPELAVGRGVSQGGFHHLDVLEHSLEALQRLATGFPEADLALRWATLLHDVGKPATRTRDEGDRIRFLGHDREGAKLAARLLRRLRQPEALVRRAAALVRRHMLPLPRGEREARRFVHRRQELLPDLLKLMIADREAARGPLSSEATRRGYRVALSRVVALLEEAPPAPPLLDGGEVMALLGLPPGPRVGEALRFVAESRAVGDLETREEAVAALRRYAEAKGW